MPYPILSHGSPHQLYKAGINSILQMRSLSGGEETCPALPTGQHQILPLLTFVKRIFPPSCSLMGHSPGCPASPYLVLYLNERTEDSDSLLWPSCRSHQELWGKNALGWEFGTTFLLLYVTSNRSGLKAQGPGSGLTADLLISSIKGLILSSWHFHKLRDSKKGPQGSPGPAQSQKNRFPGETAHPQASSSRPGISPSVPWQDSLGPSSFWGNTLALPSCATATVHWLLTPGLMAERISGNLQEDFKHGKIAYIRK